MMGFYLKNPLFNKTKQFGKTNLLIENFKIIFNYYTIILLLKRELFTIQFQKHTIFDHFI